MVPATLDAVAVPGEVFNAAWKADGLWRRLRPAAAINDAMVAILVGVGGGICGWSWCGWWLNCETSVVGDTRKEACADTGVRVVGSGGFDGRLRLGVNRKQVSRSASNEELGRIPLAFL